MPNITFKKNKSLIAVDDGTNLLKALVQSDIPVGSSCDGEGICGKCVLQIVSGADQLPELSEREIELSKKMKVDRSHRLSCQVYLTKDIKVDAPYW